MHIRRPLNKHFDKKHVVATMKHPPSQMIWGAMSFCGTAGLYFIPPNPIIHGIAQREAETAHVHGCTIFMNKTKISVLERPRDSPDLNPIKNLWTLMKDKVAYKQPSSAENLRLAIKDIWITEITQEYCESLVSSMPHRIQAVTDIKG